MMSTPLAAFALAFGLSAPPAERPEPDLAAARLADRVSGERLIADVETLAGFGTRHTLSETDSDARGIGAARRWLKSEFERIAEETGRDDVTVGFDTHRVEADGRRIAHDVDVINVVCTIPGSMPEARERLHYVIAHYDSRASDVRDSSIDAPGANDDASGVAACLELARLLMREKLDATVVLMPVAGEEQGLYGARKHAAAATAAGKDIRAVLSNDVIGDPSGPDGRSAPDQVRVFSEGMPLTLLADPSRSGRELRTMRSVASESDAPSRQLARFMAEVAAQHALPVKPRVIFRPDRFLRGGDHTAFNEVGYPAVRLTEVYEDYDRQHQDVRDENGRAFGDLPEHIDADYLAGVTLLNATTLLHLANAPSEPANARVLVAGLTNDTTLRWEASPEPDTAGYEIVWRETTSPTWDHARDAGNVTEATIDLSKDNWFFGVRAYDEDGYSSPVVFPVPARE